MHFGVKFGWPKAWGPEPTSTQIIEMCISNAKGAWVAHEHARAEYHKCSPGDPRLPQLRLDMIRTKCEAEHWERYTKSFIEEDRKARANAVQK